MMYKQISSFMIHLAASATACHNVNGCLLVVPDRNDPLATTDKSPDVCYRMVYDNI
jgi:hypothetical protein